MVDHALFLELVKHIHVLVLLDILAQTVKFSMHATSIHVLMAVPQPLLETNANAHAQLDTRELLAKLTTHATITNARTEQLQCQMAMVAHVIVQLVSLDHSVRPHLLHVLIIHA